MPRRTKEELIATLKTKYQIFDTMADCIDACGPEDIVMGKDMFTPLQSYLDWIDSGECTASQAVGAMQEALNEHGLFLLELIDERPAYAEAILNEYQSRTGRDFWQDADNPKRAIAAILATQSLKTEADYYLLKEAVVDMSSTVLRQKDRPLAEQLLHGFEQKMAQASE